MSRRICHCWSSRIRVRRSTKYGQESFNSAHALKRGTLAKGFLGKKSGVQRKSTGSVGGVYSSVGKNPRGFKGDERICVSCLPPSASSREIRVALPLHGLFPGITQGSPVSDEARSAPWVFSSCPGGCNQELGAKNALKHPEC